MHAWLNLALNHSAVRVCAVHAAPPVFEEDQVLYLGAENFTDARTRHPQMLVTFFAPWCSHSAAIAPEIAAAADKLAEHGVPVKLAKVDAIAHEALAQEHGVDTYPSLLWYRDAISGHWLAGHR